MSLIIKEVLISAIREHRFQQDDLLPYREVDAILSLWRDTPVNSDLVLTPATIIQWADNIIPDRILGIRITDELQQGQIDLDDIGIVPSKPLETHRNEVIYRSKIRPSGLLYVQATPRFDKLSRRTRRVDNAQFLILGSQIYQEYLQLLY